MSKYKIWDKKSNVYTPIGEELTPEMWIARNGWINIPTAVPIVAGGIINGAYSGELSQMKDMCEARGAVFEENLTDEELLLAIEQFEVERNTPDPSYVSNEELTATSLASIAASMEYQNMMTLEDVEVE